MSFSRFSYCPSDSAARPAAINASVVPWTADKTRTIGVASAALLAIWTTFFMFSAFATDEPPNFNTFISG
jgi:hypothetical protein